MNSPMPHSREKYERIHKDFKGVDIYTISSKNQPAAEQMFKQIDNFIPLEINVPKVGISKIFKQKFLNPEQEKSKYGKFYSNVPAKSQLSIANKRYSLT
jgi:hypothetical protein